MRVVGPHEEDSYIPIGPIWASLLFACAGFSEELLPHWAAPSSSVRQRTGWWKRKEPSQGKAPNIFCCCSCSLPAPTHINIKKEASSIRRPLHKSCVNYAHLLLSCREIPARLPPMLFRRLEKGTNLIWLSHWGIVIYLKEEDAWPIKLFSVRVPAKEKKMFSFFLSFTSERRLNPGTARNLTLESHGWVEVDDEIRTALCRDCVQY